ncbi:MAG TPA: hypothetical protein VF809_01935, partial [Candidatus Saccharimonadales bacterium]
KSGNRVSVATSFSRYCPFLLESDIISLSNWVQIDKNAILDTAIDARHTLQNSGIVLARHIENGVSVSRLYSIAHAYDLTDSQVADFLGFLNITGGLQRKRKISDAKKASKLWLRNLCLGVRYAPLSWRSNTSVLHIACGIARAASYLFLATVVVGCLLLWSGASFRPVTSTIIFCTSTFTMSIGIHEWVHTMFIQRYGAKTNLLQRGLRLGIIHPRLAPKQEITVALAGPVAGAIFCILVGGVILYCDSLHLAFLGATISVFHLLALLPWYGDGASINQALRVRKTK